MPIFKRVIQTPSTVYIGDTITWEVRAELPAGVDGELSYAWYDYYLHSVVSDRDPISTERKFEMRATEDMKLGSANDFSVVITNTYTDENSEVKTASIVVNTSVVVFRHLRWWEYILYVPLIPLVFPLMLPSMGFVAPFIMLLLPVQAVTWIADLLGIDLYAFID